MVILVAENSFVTEVFDFFNKVGLKNRKESLQMWSLFKLINEIEIRAIRISYCPDYF